MQRTSFALGNRKADSGLAARLYYQQEKLATASGEKSVKQNGRVLLTAVTSGIDPYVPVKEGLILNLSGDTAPKGQQWNDISGRGHHATKSSNGNMPSHHHLTNRNGNSFSVMRFRSGDRMDIADNLSLSKAFTAIIIDCYSGNAKGRTLTSRENLWMLGKHGGSNGCFMGQWIGEKQAAQNNVFTISTATFTGSSANYYLDGLSKGSLEKDTIVPGKLGICTYLNELSDADIACVLIWDRVLSDKERQAVEKWLGANYDTGITKKYVAAVDVGVSREGELAQIPDILPLSLLQPTENSSSRFTDTLHEIDSLEIDIPSLETEIVTLDSEIKSLNGQISKLETDAKRIPDFEYAILRLELEFKRLNRTRYATFYGTNGKSFRMSAGQRKADLGAEWNHKIRSIDLDGYLKITVYEKSDFKGSNKVESYKGHYYFETLPIGSVEVSSIGNLSLVRTNYQNNLNSKKSELANLNNIPNQVSAKRTQIAQKKQSQQSKRGEINTKRAKLTELRSVRTGAPPPQPMRLFHTDPRRLTVSSGLLGFAYSDSQPTLFDSALGRMALYFKGLNEQFFSAYYDVNTAKARWSLAAGSGSLSLVSYVSDSQINSTTLVVAKGRDADHCTVTIQNVKTGLTETWTDVPREVAAFALVLNGKAGEKVYIGKLKTGFSGVAVTSIELKDSLPREAPVGSTLIVEDSSSGSKLTTKLIVGAKANGGSKQISINSATPTINADAKIYLLLYDYAVKASVNRAGYIIEHGNLHVQVMAGSATGKVGNATAKRIADAQSPQWVGDAPGSALYFDGSDDYLEGQDAKSFQHEGDITMEAWARPSEVTGDARLIHCNTQSSGYSLGLRQQALNSALSFDGDYVTLPKASEIGMTNHDFTVEFWVKLGKMDIDQAFLGNVGVTNHNHGLHLMIRGNKPLMAFYHNDLADNTVLKKGIWYHLAFRYTTATKEQAVFVNGQQTSRKIAAAHYQGTGKLYIGNANGILFTGELDDVRIWNIARDAKHIKSDMRRRLGGQEPGLKAYYHFENRSVKDHSGNGHDGVLNGNLIKREPVASPLKAYVCFVTVDSDAIATTEPVVSNSWHHFAAVYNQSYALKFDGNDSGDAGKESMLNITGDLTIEAFIKLDTLGRKHGIVSKGFMDNGGGSSVPYAFYINETGKLVLSFEDEDGTDWSYSSTSSLKEKEFTKVAVVRKTGKEKVETPGSTKVTYQEPKKDQACRYLVKDFGTSKSPKSTRQRDNHCAPAALRPCRFAMPS